jgi:hypothetical protein
MGIILSNAAKNRRNRGRKLKKCRRFNNKNYKIYGDTIGTR